LRLWTLYWLARCSPGPVVELGVRGGDSTMAILAACQDSGKSLHSFDIEECGHKLRDETAALGFSSLLEGWTFTQKDSTLAGREWPGGMVGMVFVDTDHTYATTRAEIAAWSPHVLPGGFLVFHDYWLAEPPRDGVKPAVDEFSDSHPRDWLLETHDAGPGGDTGLAILWRKACGA